MLRADAEGVVLRVRVKPRARRNGIIGVRRDVLALEVTAAPEQNKANEAVVALLAEALDIAKSRIEIVSGRSYREKVIRVRGLTVEEFQRRLGELAPL